MLVERLQLNHFRNIDSIDIRPSSRLNLFIGANGHGKTSILEALGVLGSLRSFRDSKPADWMQSHQLHSELRATIVPDLTQNQWRSEVSILLNRDSDGSSVKKIVQINGKTVRSSAHYLRMKFGSAEMGLHCIAFNPSDHDLVRGEPSGRRTYLDRLLAAENPDYFDQIIQYQKNLEQRNSLLKDGSRRFQPVLPDFTEKLIELGAQITQVRLQWLQTNAQRVSEIAHEIAPKQASMRLVYHLKWLEKNERFTSENDTLSALHFTGHTPLPSLQELSHWMRTGFEQVSSDEQRLGSTLVGPHRDDWFVEFNGRLLRGRGSQGEVRTALLALKLTEIESFRKATGHRPILLLDDFSSELDLERRQYLMNFLQSTDLQVFISSTESVGLAGEKFLVEDGKVTSLLNEG